MTFTRFSSTDPADLAALLNRLGDQLTADLGSRPPAPHTHAWSAISGKPAAYPPAAHRHLIDDVSGLRELIQQLGSLAGDPEDTETLAALLVRMSIAEGRLEDLETVTPSLVTRMSVAEGDLEDLETLAPSLVRTTDERLADARTPLAHEHTSAEVTGLEDLLTTLAQGIDALTPGPWVDLALTSPWVPYSTSGSSYYPGVRARRTADGVQIQGMVKGGGANTEICTLPADLNPKFGGHFPAISNGEAATAFISSTGQLRYISGGSGTTYVSINLLVPLV